MTRPVAKAKAKKARAAEKPVPGLEKGIDHKRGWVICGFDTSLSSIAGAAIAYDAVLDKYKGPVFKILRWSKEDEYFLKLHQAAKSHEIVLDLQAQMNVSMGSDEIFIAQEEPWPLGMAMGKASGALKQQAEVSGAFLGGLVRYGFQNIVQMNTTRWRMMIAEHLEITIHHTKWRDPELALKYNCRPDNSGKFRAKQWALSVWDNVAFPNEIPDLPDIIENKKLGKIPRPEGSTAKAVQPADEYDALAIGWTLYEELVKNEMLPT